MLTYSVGLNYPVVKFCPDELPHNEYFSVLFELHVRIVVDIVTFDVMTDVSMTSATFWYVTPCKYTASHTRR